MVSWRADEATPERGTLRLMTVKNMSTGIEASVTGESLNSGDPAVHPAALHRLNEMLDHLIASSFVEFFLMGCV